MKWISIKDRLPKNNNIVAVLHVDTSEKGLTPLMATYWQDTKTWGERCTPCSCCSWFKHNDVKYWMPLPKSPKY